jgi:hypothetical protein
MVLRFRKRLHITRAASRSTGQPLQVEQFRGVGFALLCLYEKVALLCLYEKALHIEYNIIKQRLRSPGRRAARTSTSAASRRNSAEFRSTSEGTGVLRPVG